MKSLNPYQIPVPNSLLWHCRSRHFSIVCFLLCAILFAVSISLVAGDREFDRGDTEWGTQGCHLVVLVQPDDDDEDEEEEEEEDPVQDIFVRWNTTEAKVFGARRFLLKKEFQIELERVNAVCKLEPKQIKKLEIASKGGVKKALKDWKKVTLPRFGINLNGADVDEDREPVEEKVYTDSSDIDSQTMQLASNAYSSNVKEATAANNTFWKKTLKTTLSKEQKEVWEAFVTEQRELRRATMADAAIEKLNFKFGLTPEQKKKFVELVRPEILKAKLELVESVGMHYERYLYLYQVSKVSDTKIEKVLTEAQMQQWKLVVSTARNYGSMFEDRPARQRRRANRNVWDRAGFGLTDLLESVGAVADALEDFGNRIFKSAELR